VTNDFRNAFDNYRLNFYVSAIVNWVFCLRSHDY